MTMQAQTIRKLVAEKNWQVLIEKCSPQEFCDCFSFEECFSIAFEMVQAGLGVNSDIQKFAVESIIELRVRDIGRWESNWNNDDRLNGLCACYGMNTEEAYAACQRAYIVCSDPPPSLLIGVSDCTSYPGAPIISERESEAIVQLALTKNPSKFDLYFLHQRLRNREESKKEHKKYEEEKRANKSRLESYVDACNWHALITTYTAKDAIFPVYFDRALLIIYSSYFNLGPDNVPRFDLMDTTLRKGAVSLALREQKQLDLLWNKDWKNDMFLAYLCYIEGRYPEMIAACKRVVAATKNTCPEACCLLASCEGVPETCGISTDEAIELCAQAFALNQSPRAVAKLHQIYLRKNDKEKAAYWAKIAKQVAEQGHKETIIVPDVLNFPGIVKYLVPYLEKHLTEKL